MSKVIQIQVYVKQQLYDSVVETSKKEGISISAFVKKIIEDYLSGSTKIMHLKDFREDLWNQLQEKAKTKKLDFNDVIAELLFRWLNGEFKVENEP